MEEMLSNLPVMGRGRILWHEAVHFWNVIGGFKDKTTEGLEVSN